MKTKLILYCTLILLVIFYLLSFLNFDEKKYNKYVETAFLNSKYLNTIDEITIKKNKDEFRPETFKIFMQAPCGRLVTKSVLQDLNQKDKYKELLIYKEPFFVSVKNNFKPTKTSIYINEEFK